MSSDTAHAETTTPVEPLGRPFRIHLTSVAMANLADGLVLVAVPLIAIGLTRSPTEISALQAVFWLPWLLFGIGAGLIVDRLDRRRLRIAGMIIRATVLLGLLVAVMADSLAMPLLIGATAAYGLTAVFVDLAGSAMVPQVAPRSRLAAANGRVLAAETIMNNFVGGPLAGALLVLGSAWVFGTAAALCVLFVVLLVLGLRGDFRVARPEPRSPVADIRDGLRFLAGHPVLRPVVVAASLMNMASTAYFAVFVLWVVGPESAVGLPAEAYALLLAVLAAGAVLGSLCAERAKRHLPEVPLMLGAWVANALLLLLPVALPTVWSLVLALFGLGFSNMIGNVVSQTIRQRLVPIGMLGRIGGAGATLGYGLMPVGALLGGVVGQLWGLPVVFYGAAALCLAAIAYPLLTVSQRLVDLTEVPTTH